MVNEYAENFEAWTTKHSERELEAICSYNAGGYMDSFNVELALTSQDYIDINKLVNCQKMST